MDDFQFNLTDITVQKIAPYLEDMGKAHMSWMVDIMPVLCMQCPYGPANDAATYDLPIFGDEFGRLFDAFQQAVSNTPEHITFATVDLSRMKAKDFDEIVDELNGIRVEVIAGILAKYITSCPEVRDVRDPAAYLDLKYYTQFRALANRVKQEAREQMENFQKRFANRSSTANPAKNRPTGSTGDLPDKNSSS